MKWLHDPSVSVNNTFLTQISNCSISYKYMPVPIWSWSLKSRGCSFLFPDQCENTPGSYNCICSSGLTYNPVTNSCDDINECTTSQHSCQQLCVNTHASFRCDCNPGFLLNSDQLTCGDIDECSHSNHSCQHRCVNTFGSYVCSCDAGYSLADDGHTCDLLDCGIPKGIEGIVVKCDGTVDQYRY